jgi:transposase
MLNGETAGQFHLAPGATDLRKSIDGLAILVSAVFKLNPFSDQWFVFCNRQRDQVTFYIQI